MKLVIDGKLNPEILETKAGKPYYSGYLNLIGTQITVLPDNLSVGGFLDLRGTAITQLPEGLTVGGSLYLEGTGIINYPVIYDCGNEKRAIYLDIKDKRLIRIGCFTGNESEAIHAIKQKYHGEKADAYTAKVRECFNLVKDAGGRMRAFA